MPIASFCYRGFFWMKPVMDTPQTPSDTPAAENASTNKSEEMVFHPSAEPSMGVEIELQILDRDSGDLSPGAVRILKACEEDKVEGTSAELMQSMIEVKTGICKTVDEARDQLFTRIHRVRNIASSLGFELAMGGHASLPPHGQSLERGWLGAFLAGGDEGGARGEYRVHESAGVAR